MTSPNVMQAEMPAESQSPLAAAGEAFHNFAGRISNGLRSGYETIREVPGNIKTYAAIGASAVTLFTLANAESAVANPDPFAGENAPALLGDTTPQATTGSLEQQCATDIFKPGKILKSEMTEPGKLHQTIFLRLLFGQVDPQCDGNYERRVAFLPEMQSVKNRHRWIKENVWGTVYVGNEGGTGGELYVNSHQLPRLYYPKHGHPRVRCLEKIAEENVATGKVVETKLVARSVKVKH